MKVGGVERCEYVCSTWRVEARVLGVVHLDCVVRAVFEEGGIPSDCEVLADALDRTSGVKITLIFDVGVYFLSFVRLAKRVVNVSGTFWVRCVCFMAHVRIIRVVERS